jgi:hypothetical protein
VVSELFRLQLIFSHNRGFISTMKILTIPSFNRSWDVCIMFVFYIGQNLGKKLCQLCITNKSVFVSDRWIRFTDWNFQAVLFHQNLWPQA